MKKQRVIIGTGYLEAADAAHSSLRVLSFPAVKGKCNSVLFMGGTLKKLRGKKVRLVAEFLK